MTILPPGTILQLTYLEKRIKKISPGRFLEVGPGNGEISNLLIKLGWQGILFETSDETGISLKKKFSEEIASGKITIIHGDFLNNCLPFLKNIDLVITSMVLEHMNEEGERKFLEISKKVLSSDGFMIGLVPSSPENWGIEDEIAGHFRRYTRESLASLLRTSGWSLSHVVGLTYPISNFLLPISNYLVRRSEAKNLALSQEEKTKLSGNRNVLYKTHFPKFFKIFLNKYTFYPLLLLQEFFKNSEKCLVLYFEASSGLSKH